MILRSMFIGGCVASLAWAADPPPPSDRETVVIRGATMTIWPAENLRRRGFDVVDVPRDENAAWVYIDAINAYEDLPSSLEEDFAEAQSQDWDAQAHQDLGAWLDRPGNREAVELALQASRMERYAMPYFGNPDESLIAVLLPSLSGFRMVARFLVLDGLRREAEGDFQGAIERYGAALHMGRHATQGVTLIESLVGIACGALGNKHLVRSALRDELPLESLLAIRGYYENLDAFMENYWKGLRHERIFGLGVIDEITANPFYLSQNVSVFDSIGGSLSSVNLMSSNGWRRLERRFGQLVFPDRTVKSHMARFYDAVIDRAERGLTAERDALDEEALLNGLPPWDVFSRTLLPSLARAIVLGERFQVECRLSHVALTLRLYMLEHAGQAPESLNDLESLVPPDALIDVFGRERLRYRREADGWVVYSVGPNLIDENGQTERNKDKLDIAVRYPYQEPES